MKRFIWAVLGLIIAGLVVYLVWNNMTLDKRLREAEAVIAGQREQIAETLTEVARLEKVNSALQGKEAELLGKIAGMNKLIEDQKKVIQDLESSRPETPPGCEEVVAHYLLEIEAWKSQFSLAEKKATEYEALVKNLKEQITIKDEQIQLLKAQVERDAAILASQQAFIKELRLAVRGQSVRRVFQYAGTGVAIGLLAYILLSK